MLCDLGIEEDTVHIVLHCPYHEKTRMNMYESIDKLSMQIREKLHNLQGEEKLLSIMGKNITDTNPEGHTQTVDCIWYLHKYMYDLQDYHLQTCTV